MTDQPVKAPPPAEKQEEAGRPIEALIADWSKSRPQWQQHVVERLLRGEVFGSADYEPILAALLQGQEMPPLRAAATSPSPDKHDRVNLLSIERPEHVNAIESKSPLKFAPTGVTIVFGRNGSGKSGYARMLKGIARARHYERILTDVFRDLGNENPKGTLEIELNGIRKSIEWPSQSIASLKNMTFYDRECGRAYVSTESDFPYRPPGIVALSRLLEACEWVRERVDQLLTANSSSTTQLPAVDAGTRGTRIGTFLEGLSGNSSLQTLDAIIAANACGETVDSLNAEEVKLRAADSTMERQRQFATARKLEDLEGRLKLVSRRLDDQQVAAIRECGVELRVQQAAEALIVAGYNEMPLKGVGSAAWKELWGAARRYSREVAFVDREFPVTAVGSHCVLCQQELNEEAALRLRRFEDFIKDDIQQRLLETKARYSQLIEQLKSLKVLEPVVEGILSDLGIEHPDLMKDVRAFLEAGQTHQSAVLTSISAESLPKWESDAVPLIERLTELRGRVTEMANTLADPMALAQRLSTVAQRKNELQLIASAHVSRGQIETEIQRRKERELLDSIKTMAATTGITKKIDELSEETITEVVRDAFSRETDRLGLERVALSKVRAERGKVIHQPKLVNARQNASISSVLSEGEQTVLGLAGFFTEAALDQSKSALILDDPVTSLDHVRRTKVAERIAQFAEERQAIIFTHDVALVADLRRACNARGVPVTDRSVVNMGADKKPGTCLDHLPWKAKDVAARINEMRAELARIKRESANWDPDQYEIMVGSWAGRMSETWERIFSQEIFGMIVAEGGAEVRPKGVRVLSKFSETDEREFDASYSSLSQWATRHDKAAATNYIPPEPSELEAQLELVDKWFKRVKAYK
jgi:energy-coupling factor transporter ATP-binding protein EcfA2